MLLKNLSFFCLALCFLGCSQDDQIVGNWHKTKSASDGRLDWEMIGSLYITFFDDGTYCSGDSFGSLTHKGNWELEKDKDSLFLTQEDGYKAAYAINHLSEKELIITRDQYSIGLNRVSDTLTWKNYP